MDEITLTLNSPITEEQWDAITDVDFEHTNEITFHTKHGKEVKFVRASAQPDLIAKIQNGIKATNVDDKYSCGMRNGMRWCISLIDGKKPLYENCPSAQPERKKGEWIPMFDGKFTGGAYWFSCSKCKRIVPDVRNGGWNFCPNCGDDMRGGKEKK